VLFSASSVRWYHAFLPPSPSPPVSSILPRGLMRSSRRSLAWYASKPMIGVMPALRQDPVHVAVVGDAERGLAVGRGRGHEVVHPGGPVQHRELGVGVEVDEALPVSHSEPVPSSSHPRVAHTRLWTTYTGVISTVAAVRAALPRATTKVSRRCWVARATSSTARANAASFTFEGLR